MALTKVQADGINLGDTFAFTGTVSGTSVAGSNAFAARNSATEWSTASSGTLIQFNDDSGGDCFDTDNSYDTSTYKFTAPATGVYIFWYSIYTAQTDTENGFGFLKNSTKLNMNAASAKHFSYWQGSADDHQQTAQVIVSLSSGDTMGVCASTASDYYKGYSAWGGCRLA